VGKNDDYGQNSVYMATIGMDGFKMTYTYQGTMYMKGDWKGPMVTGVLHYNI